MLTYDNEEINVKGCPGCAYANHEFSLSCGMAFENDRFTLSQDWEIPIPGFFIVSPKRCIETFSELSKPERIEIFEVVNKTIKLLRDNNICEQFNVIFEEKKNRHFHIWIMPRYHWMKELVEDITDHIGQIFEYAKNNLKTPENIKKIKEITEIIKNNY